MQKVNRAAILCCMKTAYVNWHTTKVMFTLIVLKGRLFNVELYETVVFRPFNGGDWTVFIVSSRMRDYSVIRISELVIYAEESVVTEAT
jgi:hypothetical protein